MVKLHAGLDDINGLQAHCFDQPTQAPSHSLDRGGNGGGGGGQHGPGLTLGGDGGGNLWLHSQGIGCCGDGRCRCRAGGETHGGCGL